MIGTAAFSALLDMNPPQQVEEAARTCLLKINHGKPPPRDLVEYVSKWLAKQNTQDRYGK